LTPLTWEKSEKAKWMTNRKLQPMRTKTLVKYG
jgi:hypothetical protein